MPSNWAAIVTRAGAEELVEASLHKAGYRCYLPRFRQLVRAYKPRSCLRPLLPATVFVQDWNWKGWPKQLAIEGAVGLRPGSLTDSDVCAIMLAERRGDFDEVAAGGSAAAGPKVHFSEHLPGFLEGLSDGGRAMLEPLFGRGDLMPAAAD